MTDAHLSTEEIAAAGLVDWRPISGALLTRWRIDLIAAAGQASA